MDREKVLLNAVLTFLVGPDGVLLARKMAKIGAGCWMGYGGGIEADETPRQAAVRELREESGVSVKPEELESVAILECENYPADRAPFFCRVHVFLARTWVGKPQTTAEMADPTWWSVGDLPLAGMMPADPFWLPLVLEGKKLRVEIYYGPRQHALLQPVTIEILSSLPEPR